jgi:hypothetical protein
MPWNNLNLTLGNRGIGNEFQQTSRQAGSMSIEKWSNASKTMWTMPV